MESNILKCLSAGRENHHELPYNDETNTTWLSQLAFLVVPFLRTERWTLLTSSFWDDVASAIVAGFSVARLVGFQRLKWENLFFGIQLNYHQCRIINYQWLSFIPIHRYHMVSWYQLSKGYKYRPRKSAEVFLMWSGPWRSSLKCYQ